VLPRRHVAALGELTEEEYREFFLALRHTTIALEMAYGADGMNIGINLGSPRGPASRAICTPTCCRAGAATPTS